MRETEDEEAAEAETDSPAAEEEADVHDGDVQKTGLKRSGDHLDGPAGAAKHARVRKATIKRAESDEDNNTKTSPTGVNPEKFVKKSALPASKGRPSKATKAAAAKAGNAAANAKGKGLRMIKLEDEDDDDVHDDDDDAGSPSEAEEALKPVKPKSKPIKAATGTKGRPKKNVPVPTFPNLPNEYGNPKYHKDFAKTVTHDIDAGNDDAGNATASKPDSSAAISAADNTHMNDDNAAAGATETKVPTKPAADTIPSTSQGVSKTTIHGRKSATPTGTRKTRSSSRAPAATTGATSTNAHDIEAAQTIAGMTRKKRGRSTTHLDTAGKKIKTGVETEKRLQTGEEGDETVETEEVKKTEKTDITADDAATPATADAPAATGVEDGEII